MSDKNAEVERALALRDVMDHAVRVKREISEAKPLHRRRGVIALLLCIPLLGFSIYSFVARPEFIWGAPARLPQEQAEANARVAMFLLAQRIEALRAARGDYPESLAEIGEAVDPCKVYPLAGPCQLVHCHYKCTVYFDEVYTADYPIPFHHVAHRVEVVYIDKDHLRRCGGPAQATNPPAEGRGQPASPEAMIPN